MRGTLLTTAIILISVFLYKTPVFSVSDELLIIEIQTESLDSATEEVVTVRNNTSLSYDLTGLVIQYKSANGSSWSTKASLEGSLDSLAELQLQSKEGTLKSGMSSTGGHIRIYSTELEVEYDLIGWGTASEPLVSAVEAHEKGGKLLRKTNESKELINTGNNNQDFYVDNPVQVVEVENDPYEILGVSNKPAELKSSLDRAELQDTVFPTLSITELMADPTSPLKDADDEFIEIYNPNERAVNIEDYVIKTGSSNKGFVLPGFVLQPYEYLAIFSEDSGLTLSNSTASSAILLAPNGNQVSVTSEYDKALSSGSFMIGSDGAWVWTIKPTPNKANIYETKPEKEAVSSSAAMKEEGEVKGLSTDESRNYDQFAARDVYQSPDELPHSRINIIVLAGVGGLTVAYAIWEYRNDIGNTVLKLRRYRSARKEASTGH